MTTTTWISPPWSDYELLDFGYGKRLERFGKYQVIKPDARAIQPPVLAASIWQQANAVYQEQSRTWQVSPDLPPQWSLQWHALRFNVRPTPFKHLGIFPEQAVQWQLLQDAVAQAQTKQSEVRMLNLFSYTGMASLAAAAAGARVTTVDASRPAMTWLRENQVLSGLETVPIRLILEDVVKFVTREIKRGHTYDIIMLDPPAFGNGPKGEKWQFSKHFLSLIDLVGQLVSDKPVLLLINTYTEAATSELLAEGLWRLARHHTGTRTIGSLALATRDQRTLKTGSFGLWLTLEVSQFSPSA